MGWFSGRKKEPAAPPPAPKPRPPPKIRSDLLDLICQAARAEHPNEFGGMLREEGGVLSELMVVPGTTSGRTHALFQFHMLPIDFSVRGTVHSHPGSVPLPSDADLTLFRKYGTIHIIVAEPYTRRSWRAYDGRGEPLELQVVEE